MKEIERAVVGIGLVGAMVLATATAGAQEIATRSPAFRRETPWEAQPFSLLAHVGVFSPIGVTGVTLDYAPNRWFVLGGGAGTNARSYELEGAVKGRLLLDDVLATGAGLGLAYGQPRTWCYHAFDPPTCDAPGPVPSAFLEVYIDARSVNGVIARLYGGVLSPLRGEVQSSFPRSQHDVGRPVLGRRFRAVVLALQQGQRSAQVLRVRRNRCGLPPSKAWVQVRIGGDPPCNVRPASCSNG